MARTGSLDRPIPRPTKRIGPPCRCQAGDHRMGHSRLHLVHQFAHSTVHLRHARRPSVPIVTYRPPGMDCSENLRRRLPVVCWYRRGSSLPSTQRSPTPTRPKPGRDHLPAAPFTMVRSVPYHLLDRLVRVPSACISWMIWLTRCTKLVLSSGEAFSIA